ncbi:dethiobiotin synthase [Streptomyces sp. TP-A0874]|uniref:dethiobiotin synthase n=1 Tax=Streptomyces sp. TP-A0874 TaxID=549819 RepID=UPI000852F157|nr:dethiobiotin synthase [Streptomyces sp. TP-A0874]
MPVIIVTGTDTGVGKTVATAAIAAVAVAEGRSVAVLKSAQTGLAEGVPGDAAEAARLSGAGTAVEVARFPEPLAPATAARRAGMPPVRPAKVAEAARRLSSRHDLVLVEGAGGLLVRFDDSGGQLADVARLLAAPVVLVAAAALGTLNATALTAEALSARGLDCLGVLIGSWPARPCLASRCNVTDLPAAAGAPLLGAIPEGSAALPPPVFRERSPRWLAPRLGGGWEAECFAASVGSVPEVNG